MTKVAQAGVGCYEFPSRKQASKIFTLVPDSLHACFQNSMLTPTTMPLLRRDVCHVRPD